MQNRQNMINEFLIHNQIIIHHTAWIWWNYHCTFTYKQQCRIQQTLHAAHCKHHWGTFAISFLLPTSQKIPVGYQTFQHSNKIHQEYIVTIKKCCKYTRNTSHCVIIFASKFIQFHSMRLFYWNYKKTNKLACIPSGLVAVSAVMKKNSSCCSAADCGNCHSCRSGMIVYYCYSTHIMSDSLH